MKKQYIVFAVIALSAAGCIYSGGMLLRSRPVRNYRPAVESLVARLTAQAREKQVRGTVTEIRSLTGPEHDVYLTRTILPELTGDLLEKGKGVFTLVVDPEKYDSSVRHLKVELKLRNFDDDTITALVRQKDLEAPGVPDCTALVAWNWVDRDSGTIRLVVRISAAQFVEAKEVFTHPYYEDLYARRRANARHGLLFSGLLLLLSAGGWLGFAVVRMVRRRIVARRAGEIVGKLEESLRGGNYLSAEVTVNRYLKILPEQPDLAAFRDRLYEATANDPRKAQLAWAEAQFLREHLGTMKDRPYSEISLDRKRIERIQELIPYHRDLKLAYDEYWKLLQEAKIRNNVKNILDYYELANKGTLLKDDQPMQLPKSFLETSLLHAGDGEMPTMEELLPAAYHSIAVGNLARAEELLERAQAIEMFSAEATDVIHILNRVRRISRIKLVPPSGRPLELLKKTTITFGRKCDTVPDVNLTGGEIYPNVHLLLSIEGDKVVAEAKHLPSQTFMHGEKIFKVQLCSGDVVDLANVWQMKVHIINAVPERRTDAPVVGGLFIEGTDRDVAVMLQKVPVALQEGRLVWSESSKDHIGVTNGLLYLCVEGRCRILGPEDSIDVQGVRFQVVIG